jgi:hypothetical protein
MPLPRSALNLDMEQRQRWAWRARDNRNLAKRRTPREGGLQPEAAPLRALADSQAPMSAEHQGGGSASCLCQLARVLARMRVWVPATAQGCEPASLHA